MAHGTCAYGVRMSFRTMLLMQTTVLVVIIAAIAVAFTVTSDDAPAPRVAHVDAAPAQRDISPPGGAAATPDWRAVAKAAGPAVVVVRAGGDGQGSGALIDRSGIIVTAAHVVGGEDGTPPPHLYVDYADGTSVEATLLGRSDAHDVALLRVPRPSGDITPLPIDADLPELGTPVAAMGAPFGRAGSISTGIVSGLDRSVESLERSFQMNGTIQTDAAVNRGNSGGPLVDASGAVRGIVVQIESRTGLSSGVAFAVPAETLKALIPVLTRGDHEAAYLGVTTADLGVQVADQIGMDAGGALIQAVAEDGPAAKAGLTMGSGSLTLYGRQLSYGAGAIVALDATPINTSADLAQRISLRAPGDTVQLRIRHEDNRETTHAITLASRPDVAATTPTPAEDHTPAEPKQTPKAPAPRP